MSDPTNVGMVTQRLKAIPAEKFRTKLTRSVGGVVLAAAGFALLAAQQRGLLSKELGVWFERVGVSAIALGFLTASFEIIKAPLDYALAFAKDVLKLVRGKNGNGA